MKHDKTLFKSLVKKTNSDRQVNIMESDEERERIKMLEQSSELKGMIKSIRFGEKIIDYKN